MQELEKLSETGLIDLFYGDETGRPCGRVSSDGYVPYGWQFPDEEVAIYVEKGHWVNIWGLISRQNKCHWATSERTINGQFVMEQLDNLSLNITKETFVVLDNASVHHAKLFQDRRSIWQQRGLFYSFYRLTPRI